MNWLHQIVFRVGAVFGKRRGERVLDEELKTHLALLVEQNVEHGMSLEAARREAKLSLGGADQIKESVHDHRGLPLLETFIQDLRYAFRMLRKSPGFIAVAVLTLALGIGANTAIFSAVNGIWLEPFLNAHFSRLITVELISIPEIRAVQTQSTTFERTAIYQGSSDIVSGGTVAAQVQDSYVSDDFFPMLGVKPLLGRFILPQDVQPGNSLVAVLSYGLWLDDFGGDAHIVGRTIFVNEKPYTVIGVMPKEFTLGVHWGNTNPGVWMPSSFPLSDPVSKGRFSSIVARLDKGATIDQVKSQLDTIYARFKAQYPNLHLNEVDRYGRYGWIVTAGVQGAPDPFIDFALSILFSAVGFVLLMACINVASLLVGRSWARQRELVIRRALGATRFRLIRQLLSESLLLAIAGGALGVFFSLWGIRLLRMFAPPYTPRIEYVRLDANVLYFTMAASLFATILVGLAPALYATSRKVGATLKGGLSGSFAAPAGKQSHWFRSALVVLQIALAVVVVAGGALMAHSFYKLMHVDTGVSAGNVITMSVNLSKWVCRDHSGEKKPEEEAKQAQAITQKNQKQKQKPAKKPPFADYGPSGCYTLANENLLDGLQSLPGVQQAALTMGSSTPINGGSETTSTPYPGGGQQGLWVEGKAESELSGEIEGRDATPDYFVALGIRLLNGRAFEQRDASRPPTVAIVSQAFARKYISGNPIGKRFSIDTDKGGGHPWMTIVGEVNDVRDRAVKDLVSGPVYYVPYTSTDRMLLIVKTSVDPGTIVPAILRVIRSVDRDAPVAQIETLDQMVAESAAEPRFQTALLGSFGILGLLLAVIGTYGVASYSVVQRTHEIGVRVALGAQRGDILRLIVGQGLLLAIIGIGIGLVGALALTRFLRSLLFEIKPTDPATFIGVAILLVLVALAACYIPARRAMRVDPMVALRYE